MGPPNGGSPAPRPPLLAEDLLLYDSDGQSLLDDHALRILIALHQESLTAQEIATRYRVPIAACYRRIRRLVSLALISEAGFVTEEIGRASCRERVETAEGEGGVNTREATRGA